MTLISEKKILIVSHNSLSLHSNNGKTLTAIFSGWNAGNIAQLYFQEEIPESGTFYNFFRVRDIDVVKRLFTIFGRSACGDCVAPLKKVTSHYEMSGLIKLSILNLLRKLTTTKLLIRDIVYGTGLWRSDLLDKWLKAFKPDCVFFVGGNSVFSFNIARKIAGSFQIPLDIYITDDYILNGKSGNIINNLLRRKLLKTYRQSFGEARHVFVIGDDMAETFAGVFGRNFIPIMNSVFFPDHFPKDTFTLKYPHCIDIVYAGGLHLGRDQSLVNFGEMIKSLSSGSGLSVKLNVFSTQRPSNNIIRDFSKFGVVFCGSLDQDQLKKRLNEADFVLHVESFSEKYVALTKLSISTKIPEYLASGACLIAYGPSELSSIRLISNNSIGICLTEKMDRISIEKILLCVFNSEIKREELSRRGFEFARSKFDALTTQAVMAKYLNH